MKPLHRQVIVITGPTSGIGLVTARAAAKRGAKLVLASRSEDDLRQLSEEINAAGGRAIYTTADVADEAQVRAVGDTALRAFGGFDTWINNAGVSIYGPVLEVSALDTPYTSHAKNMMGREAQLPPPVYAPETVAEAILHAAEHPQREITIGGGGRMLISLGRWAPRLTDKIMETSFFGLQKRDRPPRGAQALDRPGGGLRERGGYDGHVAKGSLYTKASLHPVAIGAVAAGALFGALAWRRVQSR